MEHHNKNNSYPLNTKDNDLYNNYGRTNCAQQSPQNFLPPYAMPVMSHNMPMYNTQNTYNIMYGSQQIYRNQNAAYTQPVDPMWVPETCEKDNKIKDINSSCCGGMPNVYKTKSYGLMDGWFYNYDNQKYNDLPSCSLSDNNLNQCCDLDIDSNKKSVKYCSIQNNMFVDQQYKTKEYSSCSLNISQTCNLYNNSIYGENKKDLLETYYPTDFDVPKMDKTADETNEVGGESDIVVEDSEEEISDESDKEDQQCLVCRVILSENYCDISSNTLRTLYSQIPVCEYVNSLGINNTSNNICNNCLGLINTVDNLQVQLNTVKQELMSKYKSVETLNDYTNKFNTSCKKLRPRKRKFKSKDVCGIHSFKCSVCEKIFSLKKFYLFHMAKHKIKNKYLCEHCGCNFVKNSNLVQHLRKHNLNTIKIKTFICHMCGKIFKSKSNLQDHENICSGNLPFSCKVCEKKFPSHTKLNQHLKSQHEKNFTATCPHCNKGFIKNSDLKSHLLTHSSQKKYPCSKCQKNYKSLSNLNQHLKTHQEKLPHNCTICSKGFLRKENLETHINSHKGLKPFGCSICNKKFGSQKSLDAHLKIHNGMATQKMCPICGKNIRHGLEDHIRTHSTVKDIQCDVCLMKFLTKGALAKHRKRKHDNIDVDVL